MNWQVGDWAVFDRGIIQIKEFLDDGKSIEVSDGMFCTSGRSLAERLRPLTLQNKYFADYFAHYYDKLKEIKGQRGFNYPAISHHFSCLMLDAIDAKTDEGRKKACDAVAAFWQEASEYKRVIQGVELFRD